MEIKGAIFDLDGTILDSMIIWDTIGEGYLIKHGITPEEGLRDKFKALSLYQAACYYRENCGIGLSVQEIMDEINSMIEDFYFNRAKAKKGVAEFLEMLSHREVKMCLATATDRYLVERALERNGILKFFSGIFTCSEVGAGKDEPKIYNFAMQHLGTKKENTVIFEDAVHAVKTAKEAGFAVAGVYDMYERETHTVEEMADYYIRDFEKAGALLFPENGVEP